MHRLNDATAEQAFCFHKNTHNYIYDQDSAHAPRVALSRDHLQQVIDLLNKRCRIIELGCCCADICGPFAEAHDVTGVESGWRPLATVAQRFPLVKLVEADIQTLPPEPCDILILTEILEHVADPDALACAWLPLAEYAIISAPLEGDVPLNLSGGSHVWSFSREDFDRFVAEGGHKVLRTVDQQRGGYLHYHLVTQHS